ncbi:MAG TPA: hypothetical protein VLB45_06915 [Nitrosopumilaceae archaeon]|nr:hypothetical protein [Nitrosopumilaceae archaeon]
MIHPWLDKLLALIAHKMRAGIMAIGVALLVVGIIGYLNTDKIISECESEASKAGLFTSEYRQVCDKLPLLNYLMPITVIIGIGLMGYGIVAKKKIKVEKPIVEKPVNSITDDYVKLAKRFEEMSEKYDILEKKHVQLTTYMKRNGIAIPDHIMAKID